MNLDSIEARAAMRGWLWCVGAAAVLSVPVLGPLWPTLAVGGGLLMTWRYVRRSH